MLERHHLAIVRAVVHHGTLTRAAESLFLTQSALSHTIKNLEKQLGTVLWQRKGRHVQLSEAGEYLYHRALEILPAIEHSEEQLRHFARGMRGSLRIGMECHPCYQWLLRVVAPYLTAWQNVDVDVKQRFQFKGITALHTGEIDILITPDPVAGDGLIFEPVFDYEQVLVVAHDHPLAAKKFIIPTDLAQQTLITYPVSNERLDIYRHFLTPSKQSVAAHKTIETTEIILQMVAAKRGVTALPRWLIAQQNDAKQLRCLRLGDGLYKSICLGMKKNACERDFVSGFVQIAKEITVGDCRARQ